jgi:nitric oxide synthase-interacting protein
LTRLAGEALCTPSGYLYSNEAILEYLLTKTQELKEQQAAYDRQQEQEIKEEVNAEEKKRVADFEESQKIVRKRKAVDSKQAARQDLKRTSYWLADSQPNAVEESLSAPPERPVSPHSQENLRRKDLWPVGLKWDDNKLMCEVSEKAINTQAAIAYWTDKKKPGSIVLTSVYDHLIKENMVCPTTSKKIKYTRPLQRSGTSFASSAQAVQVKKYRPTIT